MYFASISSNCSNITESALGGIKGTKESGEEEAAAALGAESGQTWAKKTCLGTRASRCWFSVLLSSFCMTFGNIPEVLLSHRIFSLSQAACTVTSEICKGQMCFFGSLMFKESLLQLFVLGKWSEYEDVCKTSLFCERPSEVLSWGFFDRTKIRLLSYEFKIEMWYFDEQCLYSVLTNT